MTPPKNIRIVTAASLFDGHDAAINIMRRILQSKGAEVIHLGHNRSVHEIVECAIEEDAHAIAITSYQGGHIEFFKYIKDQLEEAGCGHIRIFGGGGGTILPSEVEELHAYGIARIYSPEDGRLMGLEGMIDDLIALCTAKEHIDSFWSAPSSWNGVVPMNEVKDIRKIARAITLAEAGMQQHAGSEMIQREPRNNVSVIGITGTGGSGKSSVTDELVRRFLQLSPELTVAVISVDPSRKKSGGALLGDRIRMNSISHPRAYMRSLATRGENMALSPHVRDAIDVCKLSGYDVILLESAGVGQSDTSILEFSDISIYVMTPEFGAASQLEKINMLDYADLVVVNKCDKAGAQDALHDVRKQYKRNTGKFTARDEDLPVIATIAAQFNDAGVNILFDHLCNRLAGKLPAPPQKKGNQPEAFTTRIIPAKRSAYLAEIVESIRQYDRWVNEQTEIASNLYKLNGALDILEENSREGILRKLYELQSRLDSTSRDLLEGWQKMKERYDAEELEYNVRGQKFSRPLESKTLSGTSIKKVYLPTYNDWGDRLRWLLQENVAGQFPYTAGVFEIRRTDEDPTRMFAGEGGPARTNKRFHYLSKDQPAIRLSTAFDSVTLYGEDPDERLDIFGKIGNAGVNVATLEDMKVLYSGFDLCAPNTSVSMTINGPAPIMLAFFLNTAIDQQMEKHRDVAGIDYQKIKAAALSSVRGTVQSDILKEDQAQNTCIFSIEFALKLMGDIQEYFIKNEVRNFYSVSISGYHIAEAGANPITQLAFTLANGFTYLEYYLSRGMHIDEFAPNLSFFFSNGMDPEYSVLGRVARRIWSKAVRNLYKGNERSQKLKYHIQTSGRSLHAQEIDFNDIRTTLQALYAVYDNCNSLHTNAYDEAITTPTEESVRRAMAIQLIINRELGTTRNENPLQGSFFIEKLTDLVEEAVLTEFERLNQRGGVLGAMERMYQRNRIQEESLTYEHLKHTGELPVIGVNTFLGPEGVRTIIPAHVIRSTTEEKLEQIRNLREFHKRNAEKAATALDKLKSAVLDNQNIFEELMETVRHCSLGQITHALYEVGGQYRRNM
jgi:methylmalonyl-CoA mutase